MIECLVKCRNIDSTDPGEILLKGDVQSARFKTDPQDSGLNFAYFCFKSYFVGGYKLRSLRGFCER